MPTVNRLDAKDVRFTESDGHGGATCEKTVNFPYRHVAPPRLPDGLSCLSIKPRNPYDREKVHIQLNSTVRNIQNKSAVYRVSAEGNTTLVRAVVNSLNLAPADVDFVTGEHCLDLTEDDRSPSVYITFTRKFITLPNARYRIGTTASDIDKESFRLTIQSSTILGRIWAYWIAYPADREHIFSISLNMIRAIPTAGVTHHQMIDFSSRVPF
ncbi:hypothetical protein BJV78DRAFT_1285955 [Lactifluus subvellereus]|nr:hypothetical protein BJV78DRAFT_1285955 [Lactifluus subvellereus]